MKLPQRLQDLRTPNLLGQWRKGCKKTQTKIGAEVGLSRYLVSDFENGRVSLVGQGETIVRWSKACGIRPSSYELQIFLILTGNAPYLPDQSECVSQVARFVSEVWGLTLPTPPIALSDRARAVVRSQVEILRLTQTFTRSESDETR